GALGSRGSRVEDDVRTLTARRRAYGTAIDASAQYRDEEFTVEPSVAAESRPMQGGRGESRYSTHDLIPGAADLPRGSSTQHDFTHGASPERHVRHIAFHAVTHCSVHDYGSCTQNGWLGSAGVVSAGPTPKICTTTSSLLLEPSQCSARAGWNM